MKNLLKMAGVFLGLGVAVAVMLSALPGAGMALPFDADSLPVIGVALGIATRVVPKTRQQLYALAYPETANQPEAISHIIFDTQTFISAATTTLTFFNTQQNDPTLGNLEQAGALTDPQWFEIHNWGLDVLQDGSAVVGTTEVGIADDIQKIMLVGRPVFTFAMSNKQYGQYPLSFMHTSGGVQGMIAAGNTAATGNIQFANNSFPDGGWNWRGNVIIPPKVGFRVNVQWSAVQTLAAGNPLLRMWMAGVLHRRVL